MPTAFEQWFQREFSGDEERAARYIGYAMPDAPPDSALWDYLADTGDMAYTAETVAKAARLILEAK